MKLLLKHSQLASGFDVKFVYRLSLKHAADSASCIVVASSVKLYGDLCTD